jgi:uncharacterized protein DUF6544
MQRVRVDSSRILAAPHDPFREWAMQRKARMLLVAIVGLLVASVLAIGLASCVGTSRFRKRYEGEKADLLHRGRAAPSSVADAGPLNALPDPVRKYLEVSRTWRKPIIKVVIVRQRGGIRMAADKPWMPFESEQAYAMEPPGFVWLARAKLAPLIHMMARDKFVDAKGNMFIRLLGIITIADGHGPEIDQGAGLRYWGEIISFPEMVLNPHLRWQPIDDRHARLSVEQDGLKLSAVVEFGADGYPIATRAERFRDVHGKPVLTPWSGHSRDWKVIDGRLFPARWESVWHLPEGDFSAVNMEILGIEEGERASARSE